MKTWEKLSLKLIHSCTGCSDSLAQDYTYFEDFRILFFYFVRFKKMWEDVGDFIRLYLSCSGLYLF
jgi:hypothetical protein